MKEFEGKIDEVLELAEEFKAYLEEDADAATATCLDEFQAHVFLERKGQTLSVRDLRAVMRNICAGLNCTRFSFIEYLVWSYQKTLKELFMVKPYDLAPLLKGLYQAMHDYQESKAQHDAKTEELEEAVAEAGDAKQVVRGLVAQAKLKEVLTRGGTRRQKDAVYHGYKQKKAQKQFEARKAAELAAKKAQDAVERKAARARMAAKMGANEGVAMANEADPAKTMHAPAEAAVTAAAPSSPPPGSSSNGGGGTILPPNTSCSRSRKGCCRRRISAYQYQEKQRCLQNLQEAAVRVRQLRCSVAVGQ